MSMSADVAKTTVTFILIIACIVGNCFVCAVVMRNRDMRIFINYLLVNLAVADMMYSTFLIPPIILYQNVSYREGLSETVLCALLTGENLAWIGAYASVSTLIAIAIERYFAFVYPYGNKGKLTMRKLKVIIPVSWVVGLILQFPAILNKNFLKKDHSCIARVTESRMIQDFRKVSYVYIFLSCTLLVLLVVLYSRVVYTLWFKRNDDDILTHQQQGALKLRKKVTLMVATVSAIFIISYGTDKLLHILNNHFGSIKISPRAFTIAHTVIMFNSAVNPYAYALINQRFRERMKRMICCNSSYRLQQGLPLRKNQSSNTAGTNSTE